MKLVPTKVTFAPGEPVVLRVDGVPADARLEVRGVDGVVGTVDRVPPEVSVGTLPVGGYGVDAYGADGALLASTAFDVLADPLDRPRVAKSRTSSSGAGNLSSQPMKTVAARSPPRSPRTVSGSDQPCTGPSCRT